MKKLTNISAVMALSIFAAILFFTNCSKTNSSTNTSTAELKIGDKYQGGKIFYFLKEGDIGYKPNEKHGLIVSPSNQSEKALWGCDKAEIQGAEGQAIGTGSQNTIDIMKSCTETGIAARLCGDLVIENYSDWYLPSLEELKQLCKNKEIIGGFESGKFYQSSSEAYSPTTNGMYVVDFADCWNSMSCKCDEKVRAIRSF